MASFRSGLPTAALVLLAAVVMALALIWGGVSRTAGAAEPGPPLLPNLVADPADGFEVQTLSLKGSPRRLLRFNGYIHNKGPGAVDFRGSRSEPNVAPATLKKVEKHETLEAKEEAELANPPMNTSQRLFTTNAEETNMERPHVEEASAGKLIYSSADGHNHWHLQEIARYTLMTASRSAVVAPAQKVGFCLDDSQGQHVETGIGPSTAVYSDANGRKFCDEWEPNATKLFEGISPGWRDKYDKGLAFQWVDVSDVLPGEYSLREEVNPLGFVKEVAGENAPSFASTFVPGYDALAQSVSTPFETSKPVTLSSKEWQPKSKVLYKIVAGPSHGTLGALSENHITYTPAVGYSGQDSFTFSAAESSSQFPEHPAVATVSIGVGEAPAQPGVAITTAPSALTAGTSATLTALATNDTGGIEWAATGGATLKPEGPKGESAVLTAPPASGTVTVTARLLDDPEVSDSRQIAIQPVAPVEAAPALLPSTVTGSGGVAGQQTSKPPSGLSRPRAMLIGAHLEMSTFASLAGRVRLSAYFQKHLLGSCSALTPANQTFTCRLKLARKRLHERIRVIASLRTGGRLLAIALPAQRIPKMVMVPAGELRVGARGASYASIFWCSPSTMVGAIEASSE
jgi:hypothetical protein